MPLCYLASHACFGSRHREGTIEQRKAKNKLILFVKLIQVVGAFLPTGSVSYTHLTLPTILLV